VSRFNVSLDRTSQFTYIFVCYHCISVHNVDQFGWICVIFTPSPIGEQSIMMSVSVCVSVCLSAIISSELHVQSCNHFLCMITMAVARSSFGGVVMCYVSPVLWMTSYLHIS